MSESMSQEEVRKLLSGGHVARKCATKPVKGSLTIALPLPPEVLHPNGRTKNHRWRASEVKKYRNACSLSASGTLWEQRLSAPIWKSAEVQCTFYMPRRRDADGLLSWMKAGFDGLQGTVIENDSGFVHLPPVQITGKAAKGERKVVLVIKPRDA